MGAAYDYCPFSHGHPPHPHILCKLPHLKDFLQLHKPGQACDILQVLTLNPASTYYRGPKGRSPVS